MSVSAPRRGSSSCHLFPVLPKRPGHRERGERLSDAIEALGGVFAHDSPGSRPTCSWSTRRRSSLPGASRLRGAASSPTPTTATAQAHSRYVWDFRLHALFTLGAMPRALNLTSAKASECEVCLESRAEHASDTDMDCGVIVALK